MVVRPDTIPQLPGVYFFKTDTGRILYIGKAKVLSHRVASYFASSAGKSQPYVQQKIAALVAEAATIDYIVTNSEDDALLLEAYLIQLFNPPYNSALLSGDPFLYLHITADTVPLFVLTRTRAATGIYFGPFTDRRAARKTYDYLIKTFQLYICKRPIAQGCLKYHLGICAGSCRDAFDTESYSVRLQLMQKVLAGDSEAFQRTAAEALQRYHDTLDFEKARQLHGYIEHFSVINAVIKRHFSLDPYYAEIDRVVHRTESLERVYDLVEKELQKLWATQDHLVTIDCFDISHMQGRHMVASAVRFVRGIPDRSQMRRFKIRLLNGQNDYAALQEAVVRRYRNNQPPDILLIDGGKGQLSAVTQVEPHLRVMSLAKREERLFMERYPEGYLLDHGSLLGRLLIGLRDYAHNAARGYHASLRKREISGKL